MSAYLTFTIIGRRAHSRNGTDEVTVTVRAISRPPDEAAEWLLRERYPSAELVGVVTNARVRYPREVTAQHLARVPLRRTPE